MPAPVHFLIEGRSIDPTIGRIKVGSTERRLEPKVMAVLCELARRPGELVTRDELLTSVWKTEHVSDGVLNRAVHLLRRALGDDPHRPRLIETVPCKGYRLVSKVIQVEEPPQQPQQPRARDSPAAPANRHRRQSATALSTRIVGRQAEIEKLTGALDRAARGTGALWLIEGEAGIGKSRLAQEIVAIAQRRGFLTWTGHCSDCDGSPPYAPWIEILETAVRVTPHELLHTVITDGASEVARLVPELRELLPNLPPLAIVSPSESRRLLFKGLRELLRRASGVRPILLSVEDLHWADQASIALLDQLATELHRVPVLLIATLRQGGSDSGALRKTMARLIRSRRLGQIRLGPLPRTGVRAHLIALSGETEPSREAVEFFYQESEGVPFFTEEVFRYLAAEKRLFDANGRWHDDIVIDDDEVPDNLKLILSRRLDRLRPRTRELLDTAAVIGRSFDFELLQSTLQWPGDAVRSELGEAIEEAEHHGVLRAKLATERTGRRTIELSFRHELIRQTLLAGISLPRRQQMHEKVAQALERLQCDELDRRARLFAHHLDCSGVADAARTAHYLLLAGRQALESTAYHEALNNFERALELTAPGDKEKRAALIELRDGARRALGPNRPLDTAEG